MEYTNQYERNSRIDLVANRTVSDDKQPIYDTNYKHVPTAEELEIKTNSAEFERHWEKLLNWVLERVRFGKKWKVFVIEDQAEKDTEDSFENILRTHVTNRAQYNLSQWMRGDKEEISELSTLALQHMSRAGYSCRCFKDFFVHYKELQRRFEEAGYKVTFGYQNDIIPYRVLMLCIEGNQTYQASSYVEESD